MSHRSQHHLTIELRWLMGEDGNEWIVAGHGGFRRPLSTEQAPGCGDRRRRSGTPAWAQIGSEFPNADLRQIDLSGICLALTDFAGIDGREADFRGSDLSYCDFHGANLCAANFCAADLCMADLSGTQLIGADLSGADFFLASLSGADLRGASLAGSVLARCELSGSRFDSTTELPFGLEDARARGMLLNR